MKRFLTFVLAYVVMFGVVALAISLGSSIGGPLAIIVVLALAIPGWKFIDFITPDLFVWMPLAGWIIYFIVKFIISAFLGIFIVPYHAAKKIMGEE